MAQSLDHHKCCERARIALRAHDPLRTSPMGSTALNDLLTDLAHLALANGWDFEVEARFAFANANEEMEEPE